MPWVFAIAAVAEGAYSITNSVQQGNQAKKAGEAASNAQAQATLDLQNSQATASSQAQAALNAKRQAASASQDIFTSPLGITGQASTARKQLLGQ